MAPFHARRHNGQTASQQDVQVVPLADGLLRIEGVGLTLEVPLTSVKVSSRLGNTPRLLRLPDGSQCETDDNDAVDALMVQSHGRGMGRTLHHWETHLAWVAGICTLSAVVLWAGLAWGVPALARHVALQLPTSLEQRLGEGVMSELDRQMLAPTRIGAERQAQLQAIFRDMCSTRETRPAPSSWRLELRAGRRIGANALALPSGIVVLTDELVALAQNDDELRGVLAHEIGHIEQRHAIRALLQASALPLVMIAVTGDLSALVSMASVLPTLLAQQQYSRAFEREADEYALEHLRRQRIATETFAAILQRIENSHGGAGQLPAYLSSHPATAERVERFRSAR